MEAYRYHIYVCNQSQPEGIPCCFARGSPKVIDALRREIASKGLANEVQITTCGSLGLCERGPNMVVYPQGIWYSGLTIDDIPEIVREHLKLGRPVERLVNHDESALRTEIELNRNKMLSMVKARDKAGVLPEDFLRKIRGFQQSRVLLTAVELDVFTSVGDGAPAYKVAQKLGTDPRATEMLLNALVALEMLQKENGIFHCAPMANRFLREGGPDDSRLSLMHSVHLWPRWSTLTECVRKGTSVTSEETKDRSEHWTKAFIAAMHRNAMLRADQVMAAVGTEGIRRMLDVGGGSGAYSIAFAHADTNLKAEILDLDTVVPLARQYVSEAGLENRIRIRAGDMRKDDFGTGYDLVFVSAICHMNSPEQNIELFKKSFMALEPRGRIIIQDFILDPAKTSPRTAALFALNMLVATRSGSSYSENEYNDWLEKVGFKEICRIMLPGPTSLMVGRRF